MKENYRLLCCLFAGLSVATVVSIIVSDPKLAGILSLKFSLQCGITYGLYQMSVDVFEWYSRVMVLVCVNTLASIYLSFILKDFSSLVTNLLLLLILVTTDVD